MADEASTPQIISRQEAKERGLRHYFTGKPCKRGHLSLRLVSECSCLGCVAFHTRKYYANNREAFKVKNAERHAAHKERNNALCRDYYHQNKETEKVRKKAWYAANKERMQEKSRRWRANNPLAVNVIYNANRRARRKGNGGTYTAKDVRDLLQLQKGRCSYCKKKMNGEYQVDHIVPLSRGGSNDRKNLQIVCPPCNLAKHGNDPIDHARTLGLLL
jgi:5-methylcytosine-specific restriction endonuclease McrA